MNRMLAAGLALSVGALSAGSSPAQVEGTCNSTCGGASCTFRGLTNTPLGDAELSLDGDCQLVVDGIGGSGQDGVVQTGLRSVYMKTTLGTPNFSLSATGTSASIRQLGVVDDQPGREIMLTELINFNGTDVRQSIDCSEILVAGYRIWIYLGTELIELQEHGIDPPLLTYPKTDVVSLACGIWPSGSVYSVARLGAPQAITLLTSPSDPGPFTGDVIFVEAFAPQLRPTEQNSIENEFFATGPITITSIEAGDLPGHGPPCFDGEDPLHVEKFAVDGWRALSGCAALGAPVCPAPCAEFPELGDSGLTPACYNLASGYLDRLANVALPDSWGPDRCPLTATNFCDSLRAEVVERLLLRAGSGGPFGAASDEALCLLWLESLGGSACDASFCAEAPHLIQALLVPGSAAPSLRRAPSDSRESTFRDSRR